MTWRDDKQNLLKVGIVLLFVAVLAYFYYYDVVLTPFPLLPEIKSNVRIYPYQEYSPFLAAFGLFGIMASYFIHEESLGNASGFKTSDRFCGNCGEPIPVGQLYCSHCGARSS